MSVFSMNSVTLFDVYPNIIPDREIKSEVMVNLNVSRKTKFLKEQTRENIYKLGIIELLIYNFFVLFLVF